MTGGIDRYTRWLCGGLLCLVVGGCYTPKEWEHGEFRRWGWKINDGKGSERALPWFKDYFTLVAGVLDHPDEDMRSTAALFLNTCTGINGDKYQQLLDAYMDAGRGEQLLRHLRRAWLREKNPELRAEICETFLQAKMSQYLWKHPEVGTELMIDRVLPPQRGWRVFDTSHEPGQVPKQYRFFAERILREGDEDFADAWKELVAYWAERY